MDVRAGQIRQLNAAALDLLVIGGGINGAGVLRDLALRSASAGTGLKIGLVEQQHFGSGTSGKNSQLIHGGLRYLKYLQFHLVRESLRERTTLLAIAPGFVKPLAFLLPMYGFKSRLVYGTGLALYDLLSGADSIQPHRTLSVAQIAEIEPELRTEGLAAGAVFYDCAIPSARFVVENILDAMARGALAANYVRAGAWERGRDGLWRVSCTDMLSGDRFDIIARKLVDARGAWSDPRSLRLVRGSHIVIPRGSRKQLTLVGTTEEDQRGGPDHVQISSAETKYLQAVVRKLFPRARDIFPISTFSSLRPLVRERGRSATAVSRDHKIWNSPDGVLHIAGGKYTTYRLMSEEAADQVCREIAPDLASLHLTAKTPFPSAERAIGDALEEHLADYLFVSTYLGYEQRWDVESLLPFARELGSKRNWDETRVRAEVNATIAASQPVGA